MTLMIVICCCCWFLGAVRWRHRRPFIKLQILFGRNYKVKSRTCSMSRLTTDEPRVCVCSIVLNERMAMNVNTEQCALTHHHGADMHKQETLWPLGSNAKSRHSLYHVCRSQWILFYRFVNIHTEWQCMWLSSSTFLTSIPVPHNILTKTHSSE